jgi:hypothetical protein
MSKKVEVYFVMYLGLMMAYFGIESDIATYKKDLDSALDQVAISKLDDLVSIKNHSQIKDNKSTFFSLELNGDFDPNNLKSYLVFSEDNKNNIKVPMIKDQGYVFNSIVKESEFSNPGKKHAVKMEYSVKPIFSDSAKIELEKQFKNKKLVDKIINRIYEKGVITNSIDVGLDYTPDAVAPMPAFKISPQQNPLNSIKGLKGDIELFIAGVKSKNDYIIQIDRTVKNKYKIGKITYNNTSSKIPLGNLFSGNVEIKATRKRDGAISKSRVKINVQKPKWKYPKTHKKIIYINSPHEFNGTLKYFDGINDLDRYDLKISGLIKEDFAGHVYEIGEINKTGNIKIQLYIDDNKIDGMEHTFYVVRPPCPEVSFSKNANIVTITAVSTGKGNKVKNIIVLKGGKKKGKLDLIDEDSQQKVYEQHIVLKNEPKVKLKILIKSNYCDNEKIEKNFINI